jgi:hypothetical protein
MKNFFKPLVAAVVFAAASTSASAQLYVSGSFSMSHSGGETETKIANKTTVTDDKNPHNYFGIGTEIGYYFNDNMAIGADIAFSHEKEKSAANKDHWSADNMFYFNPYFRFDFVSTDKISFGAKARVIIGFGKSKDQDNDHYKNSALGFDIIPVLNYKFNSNWSAGVSFGELYWKHNVTKYEDKYTNNNQTKNIDNKLGIDLTMQSLNFSVVYTF